MNHPTKYGSLAVMLVITLAAVVASCSSDPPTHELTGSNAAAVTGQPSLYHAGNRFGWGGDDPFLDDVLPVFAKRCASCHGCVDSPCQLKLTSYEGINRGAIDENVFSTRLWATEQTRMQDRRETRADGTVDHDLTEAGWRNRGFYSITRGGGQSVMAQLIGPAHDVTPEGGLSRAHELWESGLKSRNFECVGPDAAERAALHEEELAPRAMPFGCPKLEDEYYEVLSDWLVEGAQGPSPEAQALLEQPSAPGVIARWESFLNQDGTKARLAARYLYEHMFFTRIHFDEAPGEFYQLVRSWTPPGEPVNEVVTPHANDGPEVVAGGTAAEPGTRIYYRLRKYTAVIVHKDHVTWHLDDTDMDRFRELFLDTPWEAPDEIAYGHHNPFEHFEAIPAVVRARFLVENSLPLIDAMARGDVCHGSTATYAIRDHFWVWFLDPEADPSALDPELGLGDYDAISPAGLDHDATVWRERRYLRAFEDRLRELHPEGLGIDDLFAGDGTNPNAMVTVLRHDKSASAHHGAFSGVPKTFWVLSYANFERLYYALVVNYDPWGTLNLGYETWQLMSFSRADGEDMFISMLPEEHRQRVRNRWTRGFGRAYEDFFFDRVSEGRPSTTSVGDEHPARDLALQIVEHLGTTLHGDPSAGITSPQPTLATLPAQLDTWEAIEVGLGTLTARRAPFARHFPNLTLVRIGGHGGRVYTIVANRGYKAHSHLLLAGPGRSPDDDTLSINRGIVGSYPELFVDVDIEGVRGFLHAVHAVESEADWRKLVDDYATSGSNLHVIPRTSPNFWSFLDDMHTYSLQHDVVGAGILDVSEYVWPSLIAPVPTEQEDAYEPNDSKKEARELSLGAHRLVVCNPPSWQIVTHPQDWFYFDIRESGTLAVEVAFDRKEGNIDARLEGPGVKVKARRGDASYEAMTVQVTPGIYRLGIEKLWSGCQRYSVFASLRP